MAEIPSPEPLWHRIRRQARRARAFAGRLVEVGYVLTIATHDLLWRPLYRRY